MKPDLKLFSTLEDDSEFPVWFDRTVTTCIGSQIGECCDFNYRPATYDEYVSFQNKDHWLYTILMNKLKTPDGIDAVRNHRNSRSGRRVLYDLVQEHGQSTTADLRSDELLTKITNMRLDSTWDKTAREFLLEFSNNMQDYNESVRFPSQELNSDMRRAMIERAVHPNRALRAVKDRETDRIAELGPTARHDYATYMYLLKEAAKNLDKANANHRRNRRRLNLHTITDGDDDSGSDDDKELHQALQVWLSRRNPGARMNKDTWSSLDPSTQKLWDSIDDKDKAAILNYSSKRAEKRASNKESRTANVHQVTGEDTDDDEESDKSDSQPEVQVNVTEQEANEAKGKAHPGDIRRVLGSSKTKKDNKSKSRSTNHVMWQLNHAQMDSDADSSDDDSMPDPDDLVAGYWGEQETQFFP
jgi:hypothetical protein